MRAKTWWRAATGLVLAAALALQGCGGGSSSEDNNGTVGVMPLGTVHGQVLNAQDGQPVAGATVSVRSGSVQADAQGRFTLTLQESDGAVKAEKAGYATGVAPGADVAGSTGTLRVWLRPVASTQTLNAANAAVVTVPSSTAQVSLPAASLADSQTGAAFTGTAEIRITPIDPGARAEAMPGSYQARAANGSVTTIESFGALQVELRDPSTGRALNLAQGKTATIRIPLASRSTNPPATLPLYHLDESTGQWVEEGTATLVGTGANAYYEGTVSHFSYWNADKPADTVYIDGCVRNADGSIPASGAWVTTVGLDYSGMGYAFTDGQGKFHVALRKGGRATLTAETNTSGSDGLVVGPYLTDTRIDTCLVLRDQSGQLPKIVQQPVSTTVNAGELYMFAVSASPSDVRYQWRRNGVDMPGATSPFLYRLAQEADNGAVFTVVVSNANGSLTSDPATLTVTTGGGGGVPTGQEESLLRLMYLGLSGWQLALAPAEVADETLAQLRAPSTVCASGGISQALFDGAPVTAGGAISAGVQHTLDVTFAQCDIDGDVYNGRAAAGFTYTVTGGSVHLFGSTALTALSSSAQELTGNGSFAFDVSSDAVQNSSQGLMTPAVGASLRSQASGLTATFASGSMGWRFQGAGQAGTVTVQANNLAFTVDGVSYLSTGQLVSTYGSNTVTGSGELRLSSGGTLVGRMFYDNGVLKFEVNGQVKPFSAAGMPAARRR